MQIERNTIIEFLKQDPELDFDPNAMSLSDLIDELIDRVTEAELDYSILSTAFLNRVNPDRFDQFYDAVMGQYETIREGDEIPEPVLDRIASSYR